MSNGTDGDRPLIGGRYEVGELLGRGGMAEVRKGNDLRLGRVVAIKRLRTDLASDATFQARFRREQITFGGKSTAWTRAADSGNALTFHFCPTCGSTVYWEGQGFADYVAVAIGTFADPSFPPPTISVWEESRHPWLTLPLETPLNRMPKQG